MRIESLKIRVDELLSLAQHVLSTETRGEGISRSHVSSFFFNQFRAATLSFLSSTFGSKHSYYTEFDGTVQRPTPNQTGNGMGILAAVKLELEGGWMFTTKGLISAEIFSDFLEMAEHLLQEGYKDPAAVMIGSVLEEHLRQLCVRNNILVEVGKGGRMSPKKAELLNADLANATVYNKLDQKSVTSWLDLRNKAAHGKYSEYSKEQVDIMYRSVLNFIARTT